MPFESAPGAGVRRLTRRERGVVLTETALFLGIFATIWTGGSYLIERSLAARQQQESHNRQMLDCYFSRGGPCDEWAPAGDRWWQILPEPVGDGPWADWVQAAIDAGTTMQTLAGIAGPNAGAPRINGVLVTPLPLPGAGSTDTAFDQCVAHHIYARFGPRLSGPALRVGEPCNP